MPQNDYSPNVLSSIQATLSQYPILADKIENEMYNRLLQDGYISVNSFTENVRDFALLTQKREGLKNPFAQEGQQIWEKRLSRVQSTMVRKEFALRYSLEDFNALVASVLRNPAAGRVEALTWHNIQHATDETIIEQALSIEHLPAAERQEFAAQLMSAKVALIRRLLSERASYIRVAKNVFSIHDLLEINRHRIGRGLIGSKAAQLLLANRILHSSADRDIRNAVGSVESIYIGAEEFNNFMVINNIVNWMDQIYKTEEECRNDYPKLQEDFSTGEFSQEIVRGLKHVIETMNGQPFIVRSSSLLENSFTHPFNSMYRSVYLPNQGTDEENLESLEDAIRTVYASIFNPNALAYRRKNGLTDYTEAMAILIQRVDGNSTGAYFFPDVSGLASCKSPYKWTRRSRKDEGFMRFVVGLGTHAIYRSGDDFAHIVELAEPNKRHTTFTQGEEHNTQEFMRVLNLKTNESELLDVQDVLCGKYPLMHLVAQKINGDRLLPFQKGEEPDSFCITCNELIQRTDFTRLMRDILQTIQRVYGKPVMVEFSAMIDTSDPWETAFKIQIHNCRVCSDPDSTPITHVVPSDPIKRDLFTSDLFIGDGVLKDISYVIFVDPDQYMKLYGTQCDEFCSLLGKINAKLARESFIFVAATRWGTRERHGIPVPYSAISNAKALVELSGIKENYISDPFCGTQFFQSMQESGISSIITNADKSEDIDYSFFTDTRDLTSSWIDIPEKFRGCVRILSTNGWYGSRSLVIHMDPDAGFTRAGFI